MAEAPIIALIGPTGVGKTELSLSLAEHLGAEIVSVDSRQVYRNLTIGTAKPSQEELGRVPHHFIDELDLDQSFSAGRFASEAQYRIDEILGRGHTPIVVGGSTLYIEALLHGLADIPDTTQLTRSHLMARLRQEGPEALFEELRRVDPSSARSMDATKSQRIVRALEVYQDTGRPISSYQTQQTRPRFAFAPFVLTRPRTQLYERINLRVDAMLAAGLLEENRSLLDTGFAHAAPPLRTIGYREPMAYLRGEVEYETMVDQVKQNTRRYAKRQLTWFRRRSSYKWIDIKAVPHERILADIIAITAN